MHTQDPVKIPDLPGKISFTKVEEKEYVRYLTGRKYNSDRGYSEPRNTVIGRRCEIMPGLMYPNDNYDRLFTEKGEESMEEKMTPEERTFAERNRTYHKYLPFFEALYYEFRQQARKRPEDKLNRCKAECLNRVLDPLRDMMRDEEYAELLRPILCKEEGKCGMNNSDVMMLLTQYKSALDHYHKAHK